MASDVSLRVVPRLVVSVIRCKKVVSCAYTFVVLTSSLLGVGRREQVKDPSSAVTVAAAEGWGASL